MSAEPVNQIDNYDSGKLHDLADRVALETRTGIDQALAPAEVSRIIGQAQLDFSRILIRQNDEIIRLLRKIAKEK